MKIVAVVVTYNRKECLLKNIRALLDQTNAKTDILIVDNASTDGTEEAVASYRDAGQIMYENTGENLGGAGGFNYGIRRAWELGYDYFWLMDDDVYPYPDALSKLIQAHEDLQGDYGYLAGVVLWKDGTECRMNKLHPKAYGAGPNECYKRIDFSTFVSMFLPRKTVEEFGLPIKEFFIWGDDIEYTRRITAKKPAYMVSESKVLHDTKNNEGFNIAYEEGSLDRYRYAYRNEMFAAMKEGKKRVFRQRLRIWKHIARVMFRSKGRKGEKIRLIREATREGRSFHPEIEYVVPPPLKICLVCSSGGHLTHLQMLKPIWENREHFWVTFDKEDASSQLQYEQVYYCYFPTNRNIKNLIRNTGLAWRVLRNERPDIILSCGAGVAIPFFYLGKLFGAKLVYIEVFDRVNKGTLTGKIVYPITNKFIVQWEEMKKVYRKATNLGSIF